MSAPLRLTVEDKLDALRSLDPQWRWESLDDRRFCTLCAHVISGRQISVFGGTRAHAPLRLECPTDGCTGTPKEWTSANGAKPRRAPAGDVQNGAQPDGNGTHNAGYVHIRAETAGVYITHNGRAAVVRRSRFGSVMTLSEFMQLQEQRAQRTRVVGWLVRRAASVATDVRSVLKLLRPTRRGHFRPVH